MKKSVINLMELVSLAGCSSVENTQAPVAVPVVVTETLEPAVAETAPVAEGGSADQVHEAAVVPGRKAGNVVVMRPIDCTHLVADIAAQISACAGAAEGLPAVYVSELPCDAIAPDHRREYAICVGSATGLVMPAAVSGRTVVAVSGQAGGAANDDSFGSIGVSTTDDYETATGVSSSVQLSRTDGVRTMSVTVNGNDDVTVTEGMNIRDHAFWPDLEPDVQ